MGWAGGCMGWEGGVEAGTVVINKIRWSQQLIRL